MSERPALLFKLALEDGQVREIKWTYGLQLDIQRMLPDPEVAMNMVMSDPYTRDYLMRRAMTDTRKSVEDVKELVAIEDVPVDDPDELLRLVDWVVGHTLYFFGSTAGSLSRHGASLSTALRPSAPLTSGSEASPS